MTERMTDAELAVKTSLLEKCSKSEAMTTEYAIHIALDLLAEVRRLRGVEQACWTNPEKWMQWCDIRVLEENERLKLRLAQYEPPEGQPQSYLAAALRAVADEPKWMEKADKIKAIMLRAAAELDKWEPPEGERDETMVCLLCGTDHSDGHLIYACDMSVTIPRWRYNLAEKIKRGEV